MSELSEAAITRQALIRMFAFRGAVLLRLWLLRYTATSMDTIGVYIALASLHHISPVADFVFLIVLARQKISPVSHEKVWLSLS